MDKALQYESSLKFFISDCSKQGGLYVRNLWLVFYLARRPRLVDHQWQDEDREVDEEKRKKGEIRKRKQIIGSYFLILYVHVYTMKGELSISDWLQKQIYFGSTLK